MNRRNIFTLGAAVLAPVAAALALSAPALAKPGPTVTIRVEGMTHTLLETVRTRTHTGSITKGGAPRGKCPATSAAGALDAATHHHWGGPYKSAYSDFEITSILGESHPFTAPFYWSIWVDNRYATAGACHTELHSGEHLLFAVEPDTSYWYPLALSAPRGVSAGHSFSVKVVWFNTGGGKKPLAGARVTGAGVSAVTNKRGIAHLVAHSAGTLVLHAELRGYIRAVPIRVTVTG